MTWRIILGNNLDILPSLADNSIDSIVTDPPYELGFMGKKWDSSGIAYSVELWQQCLRVLKPGGHLLSFGGTRTYHRVAVAIEDAGFELRDSIAWLYGSGFPKSLDVSKAIDKAAGAEREVIGKSTRHGGGSTPLSNQGGSGYADNGKPDITAPSTPEAQQWQGWGTALKPAFEPVIIARKPIEGTVANNVLKWGTGGLNIDGSRVGRQDGDVSTGGYGNGGIGMSSVGLNQGEGKDAQWQTSTSGRWPANIILDPYTAELLDEQSGTTVSKAGGRSTQKGTGTWASSTGVFASGQDRPRTGHTDSGGASRFFYVAKASKLDRNEGLEELPEVRTGAMSATADGTMLTGSGNERNTTRQNFHPTVKPTSLMEYLINLVTPPNGTVLDPFAGSGSTGKAAILNGFDFIGIELTAEYLPIINGRLEHAEKERKKKEAKEVLKQFEGLF
jgi:DNA modification methylase